MDRQRYARVKEIFREAMRWAPEERAAVIAALAEGDAAVRDEVLSLLAHHDDTPLLREPTRKVDQVASPPAPPEAPPDTAQAAGAPSLDAPPNAAQAAGAPSLVEAPPPSAPPSAPGDPVAAQTLAELLRAERASGAPTGWPLERVIRSLDPIARALASAADRGVVHGAVRADHVRFVEVDGELVAELDGIGSDLHGAHTAATIDVTHASSAAPEQLLPALGPTGPWTDVYGLALLCVELMLGRPMTEGSAAAALARTRDEAVQPTPHAVGLDVPAAVEAVMVMAMAMRPMQRYQDVGRFWTALRDSLAASQSVVPRPSRPPRAPADSHGPAKLQRSVWALGAGLIVIAAAVVTLQRCG